MRNMNFMKRSSSTVAVFAAVASVVLFSGQVVRPYVQPQQRQPAQQPQQPVTPPRPRTNPAQSTTPAAPVTPTNPQPPPAAVAAEMPSLFWLQEDIKFPESSAGTSPTITLLGNPKTEGLYVTRTLIPKGAQTIPHVHPDSRTITVLSGVCYYGRGEEFDEEGTIPMPPGSFFTEPAGVAHFIWAKDGDVILQTTAVGPSGTQLVPQKTAASGKP